MDRLLSINNYHYARGGAEVVYLEHNRLIEERGWEVVHFSMQHPNNLASPWSDHFIEELEFDLARGSLDKARKGLKSVYSFEARRKLDALLAATHPDVAHAHNIYHHLTPAILATLKARGVPVVLTLHDLKIACPAYKMLNASGVCEACKGGQLSNVIRNRCMKGSLALSAVVWVEASLHRLLGSYQKHVDRFVVPSHFFIDKFVEWGWPRDKFVHVANFIDPAAFNPVYSPGERFVYFGRLSEEKGLETFVRAAAASGASATIVGTGPQQATLQSLAQSLGADVEFTGYQTGEALKQHIASARAVVLPSEWYENGPISILEAYALGKPVIGARIGGIPEMIEAGATGDVFESGSVEELSELMGTYAAMPAAEIEARGQRGRAKVAAEYTAERYMDEVLALYAGM